MTNTTGEGRFVSVTSAQRRAAAALVKRSKTTGRSVSPSVVKIANAKSAKDAGYRMAKDNMVDRVIYGAVDQINRTVGAPAVDAPADGRHSAGHESVEMASSPQRRARRRAKK